MEYFPALNFNQILNDIYTLLNDFSEEESYLCTSLQKNNTLLWALTAHYT